MKEIIINNSKTLDFIFEVERSLRALEPEELLQEKGDSEINITLSHTCPPVYVYGSPAERRMRTRNKAAHRESQYRSWGYSCDGLDERERAQIRKGTSKLGNDKHMATMYGRNAWVDKHPRKGFRKEEAFNPHDPLKEWECNRLLNEKQRKIAEIENAMQGVRFGLDCIANDIDLQKVHLERVDEAWWKLYNQTSLLEEQKRELEGKIKQLEMQMERRERQMKSLDAKASDIRWVIEQHEEDEAAQLRLLDKIKKDLDKAKSGFESLL
jgi:hypothetical protein